MPASSESQVDQITPPWLGGGWAGALVTLALGIFIGALIGLNLPGWVFPWFLGISVLVWAYHCVVKAGYPIVPTAAWAIPVAALLALSAVLNSPWWQLAAILGFAWWFALYLSETARHAWYLSLFRWRPSDPLLDADAAKR